MAPNNTLDRLPRQFRVGGSGFTAFQWMGHIIGFAQSISHTSPRPVALPVAVQPLDQQYPMQILVPAAIREGTLDVELFEMYNYKVWDHIMRITDHNPRVGSLGIREIYNDLSEIFLRLSALAEPVRCTKIVYPPSTGVRGGSTVRQYADTYHNCMIVDIRDDEIINIGSMEVIKRMTIMYTHVTRHSDNTSR